MQLQCAQKQAQLLSPQMLQSMQLLQMGTQELWNYLENAALENPVLDLEPEHPCAEEDSQFRRKLEWIASMDHQNRVYERQDREDAAAPAERSLPDDGQETLFQAITAQLPVQGEPQVLRAARFLAAGLNGNGWLDEPLETLVQEAGCPLSILEQGLELLQSLEPAGVGARTLSECLTLQLLRRAPEDTLALNIAAHYLQPLAKSRYGWMARELGVSLAEVRSACDRIRALNPRPGSGFAGPEPPLYVTPDLFIVRRSGLFEVVPNNSYLPSPHISAYYTRLARESEDAAVQDYLAGKLRQAKWILQHVEQRQSTLVACAQCILSHQEDFFQQGPDHLRPLALSAIAQTMGVHESTVSRALKDKYLMCDYGVFPMSHFFSRALGRQPGGAQVPPDAAKQLLHSLIGQEDKRAPLSDQMLCERMEAQGLRLSRRTVAKYRDELGIPGASGRRQSG